MASIQRAYWPVGPPNWAQETKHDRTRDAAVLERTDLLF